MRFILSVGFMLGAYATSAEPLISDPLVLKSGKMTVIIPQLDSDGPKDWWSLSCRGGGDIAVLHAALRRGNATYVLFTLAGWSRGAPSDRGLCGAGWERQINWMKIEGGRVVAHQQRDIESCWQDAYGSIDGWKGAKLHWSGDERDGFYECFFDSQHPEDGIQVAEFSSHEENPVAQPVSR